MVGVKGIQYHDKFVMGKKNAELSIQNVGNIGILGNTVKYVAYVEMMPSFVSL